jgi:hypothetical protein
VISPHVRDKNPNIMILTFTHDACTAIISDIENEIMAEDISHHGPAEVMMNVKTWTKGKGLRRQPARVSTSGGLDM